MISETYENIIKNLETLKTQLEGKAPLRSLVCAIPHVSEGDDSLPVTEIEPVFLQGHPASHEICKSFRDLKTVDSISKKSSRRWAGVIWFDDLTPGFGEVVCELVEKINADKTAIKTYITENYPDRNARFEALHHAIPHVMSLHLYRSIRAYHRENIEAVRFSWQQKDLFTQPDKTKLLSRLGIESMSSKEMETPMNLLIQKIISIPENQLRVRRPAKIQPSANITFRDEDALNGRVLKTVTAPLPYIIIQNEALEIKPLQIFSPRPPKVKRKDSVKTDVLQTFKGESIEWINPSLQNKD